MTKATVVRRLTKMLGESQRGVQHGRTVYSFQSPPSEDSVSTQLGVQPDHPTDYRNTVYTRWLLEPENGSGVLVWLTDGVLRVR